MQFARRHVLVRIIILALVLSHGVDLVGDVIGWCLSVADIFEALGNIRYQRVLLRSPDAQHRVLSAYRERIQITLSSDVDGAGAERR